MKAFLSIVLAVASGSPTAPVSSPVPAVAPASAAQGQNGGRNDLAPLREIGHVKATTTFCRAIIEHATQAVELGVDNDRRIDAVVRTIRAADFDSNPLSRNNALQLLNAEYAPLAEAAVVAERSAQALHVDAKGAPSEAEAASVVAFADALGGALHRQRTIARDLGAMITIFTTRPPMTRMEHDELMVDAQLADTRRGSVTFDNPQNNAPPLLSTVAAQAADQFVYRQGGISHDELRAAQLVDSTFGGC